MSILEVFLIGVGLSMDALAVSMCKGLAMDRFQKRYAFTIAGFFGFFQALMPVIGWLLGSGFRDYIEAVDHWVAFGLLLLIGGKMILDAVREMKHPPEEEEPLYSFRLGEMLLLSIATSIDALAVGISFAMLGMKLQDSASGTMSLWSAVLLIGVTTFGICFAGVFTGHRFGGRFRSRAEIIGGIVLIAIGIKILIEHIFFTNG
ncbi:MAG: manganese efflux pump [Parasporobacterium sp.]|nr:manganese efflux pump [Parasporobacterium sp.]